MSDDLKAQLPALAKLKAFEAERNQVLHLLNREDLRIEVASAKLTYLERDLSGDWHARDSRHSHPIVDKRVTAMIQRSLPSAADMTRRLTAELKHEHEQLRDAARREYEKLFGAPFKEQPRELSEADLIADEVKPQRETPEPRTGWTGSQGANHPVIHCNR